MKIRTKITLLELSTILFVGISLFFIYRAYTNTTKFKTLQVRFNSIIDMENKLNTQYNEILYTEEHIVEAGEEILNTYNDLKYELDSIKVEFSLQGGEFYTRYKKLYFEWYAVNDVYYLPLSRYFRQMITPAGGFINIIANNGLVRSVNIIQDGIANGEIKEEKLQVVLQTIDLISTQYNTTEELFELLEELQEDIKYEMEKNIATNYLALFLIIVFIVIISMFISTGISKGLVRKIHNVEDSFHKISGGDLTTKLFDKSGDEFSELSENFNQLNSMLLDKSDSMRAIMNEVGEIISETIQIDTLLIKITQIAKESTGADAAAILLVDKFSDILRVEHIEGFFPPPYTVSISVQSKRELIEEKFKSTPIAFGSTYLSKESVLKGEPFFVRDTEKTPEILPLNSNPQNILFLKSNITIPLVVSNKLLGVISLVKTGRDETFSDLDFSNMISFVEYVSLTIDNLYKYIELLEKSELKREIGIASEIQTQLLPKKIPVVPNADITAFSNSARGISGDYYDIYKVSKTKSVATVCDVAGKGIPAALVLVIIRTILHLASTSRSTAMDLLTFLNKSISDRVKIDYFATVSTLVFDSVTNKISVSIAGDTPLLIFRKEKEAVERIYHNDLPIGIDMKTQYKNIEVELDEDDVLYMFSDGLLEIRNDFNDTFSIDELESFILEYSNNRSETISVKLQEYIDEFRGKHERVDDETVIIFKKI